MEILIKELDPGQKYIFQARAKSATGKTSSWSTAFEHTTQSDTVAPSPITGLVWNSVGTSFVATWTKPTTDSNGKPLKDFKDYKVVIDDGVDDVTYYVSQERFDFSLEANRNAFGQPSPNLDISIQVRDNTGNLSTVVTDNATNPTPSDVTDFVADGVSNGVALSWSAVTDNDLKYYEVYMETTGSGFTPGPSNLVYTGSSTSFLFPSSAYITHYFKVRALDVFNQGSANYASASAVPESSSGIDLTPPDDPTNVDVTTIAADDGSSTVIVDWDAVGSSNLSDYLVRYSTDEVAWRYINIPSTQTSAVIANLLAATDYYVQVAAMSQANVKSDFVNADIYPIETAADTTAPSQPSAPSVSTTTLAVQVSHDMTKQGGGDLESDVAYLEVHASITTGFTPNNTTLRGTIDTAGPGIDVSGVFYFPATTAITDLYWKVIAVDRSKNKSAASNQATGVPGLVLNANIADATITSAKIQDLEANKLTAGTGIINDLDIKSTLTIDSAGELQSSNWNGTDTGYNLDTSGLTIYSGSVSAAALLLQDSANILPPAFADFEFNEDYYHTGGVANSIVWSTVGTGVNLDILETGQKFGNKCLRVFNGVIANPTVHDLILAPSGLSATGVNVDVSPGTYIFSGYFKKNGSVDALLKFGFYPETGLAITSSAVTVNSTSWTRFEAQLVVPSGVSRVKAYLEFGPAVSNTGYDMLIDGLQVERKITASTSAGLWRPPSKTTIDGGQIVTGSIRSSAPSSIDENKPAWSINMAGNMEVGDAIIQGTVIVGDGTTVVGQNIVPDQFASFEESPVWYTDLDNFGEPPLAGTTFVVQSTGGGAVGAQYFRSTNNGSLTSGNQEIISFAADSVFSQATNNIYLKPGAKYILSCYVKNLNPAKDTIFGMTMWQNASNFTGWKSDETLATSGDINITSYTTWTRVWGWLEASSIGSGKIGILCKPNAGTNGYDVAVDGIMVELATEGQVAPSTFTAGIVNNSYIASHNFVPGVAGWKIDSAGNSEFNKSLLRGALEVSSELGSIEINLMDTRPTIKLWNDDYSNFAWMNVVDDTPGQANVGINNGPLDSSTYPGTLVHSRMYLVSPGQESMLGMIKSASQTAIGGRFGWNDASTAVRLYDNSSIQRARLFLDLNGSLMETLDTSGGMISRLWLHNSGYIKLWANSSTPSSIEMTAAGTVNITNDRTLLSAARSTGTILLQGGDGSALNGKAFIVGGTVDPYFHISNEGWNSISTSGSWTGTVFYKLLATGEVIFRGSVSGGTNSVGQQLIATLPVGYRPVQDVRCHAAVGSAAAASGHVQMNTAGQLVISQINGTASYWLNQLRYSVV